MEVGRCLPIQPGSCIETQRGDTGTRCPTSPAPMAHHCGVRLPPWETEVNGVGNRGDDGLIGNINSSYVVKQVNGKLANT